MESEAALLPKLLQVCDNKMEVVALGLVKGKADQHCLSHVDDVGCYCDTLLLAHLFLWAISFMCTAV